MSQNKSKQAVQALKQHCSENNISQGAIADKLGRHRQNINRFFSGRISVTLCEFLEICEAVGVKPGKFL